VHFIINNITTMNIEQKVNELKQHVDPEYWPWFANYLVVKRAAQVGRGRGQSVDGWRAVDSLDTPQRLCIGAFHP
jgi:hypothetical protein